jgi:hypothetical protein
MNALTQSHWVTERSVIENVMSFGKVSGMEIAPD